MEIEQRYGDEVTFVGLPSLAELDDINAFIGSTGIASFLQLPDPDGRVWQQFGVLEQRTYVYINDDGTWRRSGYGSLEADVEALIAQ